MKPNPLLRLFCLLLILLPWCVGAAETPQHKVVVQLHEHPDVQTVAGTTEALIGMLERNEIQRTWSRVTLEQSVDFTLLWRVAGGLLVALLLLLYWNRSLARSRAAVQRSEALFRTTIDALSEHLCVLDEQGEILTVNRAWREFTQANLPVLANYGIGINYLSVCDLARGENAAEASRLAEGLRAVLRGGRERFQREYLCDAPDRQRWFIVRVFRFPTASGPGRVLVTHEDITLRKQAELAMQTARLQAEEALAVRDTILENALVTIAFMQERRFVWVNDHMVRMFGYPREEILGQSVGAFYADPADFQRVGIEAPPVLARGDSFQGEFRFRRKDGRELWCLISGRLVDHTAPDKGAIYIVTDIDERKHAEEQLRKLSRAVEQNHSNIIITNLGARIEFVNPAFTRATGYTLAEALGQNPRILQSGEHPPAFYRHLWKTLVRGEVWQGELHNRRKDGSLYWEFATISPVKDERGETTHYVAVKEDITAQRQQQDELRQAKEAAEAANRAKSAFLANMSHELRTPLNAMLGHAQILQRDAALNGAQQRSAETIKRSGDHLITLINDILDLAKIEVGRLDLTPAPCDPHALFRGLEELFRMRTQDKGIGFRYQETTPLPALVEVDEKRLRQVVMNLLSNAVKFTAQGEVRLEVGYAQGLLWIKVIDSGIGIPPDRIEGLFQPFQQEGTAEYRNQGTGLGLAIVKQLLTQMGGGIEVASVLGQGSRFTLRLPLVVLADTLANQPEQVGIPQGGCRLDGGADPLCLGAVAQTLTPAQREALLELAGRGNILEIRKLVESLPADGEGQVGRLREAAGRLDIKALRRILEE